VRTGRDDSIIRRTISFLTNKTTARLTGIKLSDYGCMLRAYSRDVVRGMCQGKEISTFIPALGAALARSYTEVEVTHHPRVQGSSKYNFAKLLSLHLDLVTSFSLKPIRALLYLGVAISLAGMGFGLFLFIRRLIVGPEVEGVFTLFAILFVFVGCAVSSRSDCSASTSAASTSRFGAVRGSSSVPSTGAAKARTNGLPASGDRRRGARRLRRRSQGKARAGRARRVRPARSRSLRSRAVDARRAARG
jgi:hypothetical protein